MNNDENRKTINKEIIFLFLGLCIFCGMIGYAFGADAGYAKGFQDCTQNLRINPLPLQSP